jgi:hypothetical protein
MYRKLVIVSAVALSAANATRHLQTTKTFPGVSCQFCVYQGYSFDAAGCWDQRTNTSRVGGNTAQSFDDCFANGYYNNGAITYAITNQTFSQSIACPATANETFSIVWNNANDGHRLLNTTIGATSIPTGVSLEKAGFIGAACSNNQECGPKGQGVRNYVMAPDEKVGVWMLCQGNKTWNTRLLLQAQFTVVPEPESILSGGDIAGIIIGSIIGALFVVGFAFMYYNRHRKTQLPTASPDAVRELQGEVDYSPSAGVANDENPSGTAPRTKVEEGNYESARAPLSKVKDEEMESA